jgi:DNA-binding ferritin-like protein (Dps family)
MAARWIELVTGSFEDKRRYRQCKARIGALPEPYRSATEALERYLMYRGGITKGDVALAMLDDLIELFEQNAADGTPIRAIVGDDPVDFAEEFLQNYADGQWINKERDRLTQAINRACATEHTDPASGSGQIDPASGSGQIDNGRAD